VTIAKATISEVTIANLDAPVKGTTLDTEATCSTAGVENVTIVWKNGDETVSGNAEDNTVYTAVVTLTANSNYVFASQTTANAISEKEGTVTRTDDTHIDVAYTFNATESGTGDEPTTKITVHTIGDSTMSHYDQSVAAQAGMDGWGDYLQDCMKSDWVTVKNWADRGETAKSYYNYYWNGTKPDERPDFTQEINKEVSAGDYVIIQFGHNDSKAYSTVVYEEWMGKLVDAVKEKGATLIIASSICRARFDSDGKITRLGRIDTYEDSGRILEDGATIDDYTFDYPYHAQQVANAKGIEFIDVTSAVKEMFENYGEAKTKPDGEDP